MGSGSSPAFQRLSRGTLSPSLSVRLAKFRSQLENGTDLMTDSRGVPDDVRDSNACLRSQRLPVAAQSSPAAALRGRSAAAGDDCECLNGGRCRNNGRCGCKRQFDGDFCETLAVRNGHAAARADASEGGDGGFPSPAVLAGAAAGGTGNARAMPAPRPHHLPVPPGLAGLCAATALVIARRRRAGQGGTGQWRGRGAGCKPFFFGLGGAGMARAWRGHVLFPQGSPGEEEVTASDKAEPLVTAKGGHFDI
eukprot:gene1084-biopygen22742